MLADPTGSPQHRLAPVGDPILSRLSERIQEPLYIIVISKQVKHYHVFLRLREHDAALTAESKLKHPSWMNLAHSQPGMAMGLAKRTREFLDSLRQLLTKILRGVFELSLDAARQRDSHARRRGLVIESANDAGDSCTWATPVSNSARASCVR